DTITFYNKIQRLHINALLSFQIQLLPYSILFPYTTLFRSTDNNTVGMGDAGIKSAIQGSNVPNPDEPLFRSTDNNTVGMGDAGRSEERFSRNAETDLVCRLLLEKKKTKFRKIKKNQTIHVT